MRREIKPGIEIFNRDIRQYGGYQYTTEARLSSLVGNQRLTEATLEVGDFRGKRVLDFCCGDGTYSLELFRRGQPESIHGFDLASEAIRLARQKVADQKITFDVQSADDLPYADNSFDITYVRGVLHHLEKPVKALSEALRVSPTLVVTEPNGYNPILKIMEKIIPYYRKHGEKSYTSIKLDRWVEEVGGRVLIRRWVGVVPMFCPDWFVKLMKLIEPLVEGLPLINTFCCGMYVFMAERRDQEKSGDHFDRG